jgi:phosphoglucosamine mutase
METNMGRLFGTDGVRGLANKELDAKLAFELGRAGAYALAMAKHKPTILVGRDTRVSGHMLEAALVAGICSVGAEAMLVGVIPTPGIAYLTRHYEADAGVVISASHNAMEYNGIKFFDGDGYKLPDAVEERIEAIILDQAEELPHPTGEHVGMVAIIKNAANDYIDYLKSTMEIQLDGLKVVLDCANGAAYKIAPEVFKQLGADVHAIYIEPDGTNINDLCGSTHPKKLKKKVLELGADVGLAFDGDADRLIAVNEHGHEVDGDQILVALGLDMKQQGKLKQDTVVATVMSNMGFDIALGNHDCKYVKTKVGDRYVLEEMLKKGYNLGGEQSGHIIFLDYNTTGDGTLSGLQLLATMKRSGKTLSQLGDVMKKLPQVLVNAKVSNEGKTSYMDNALVAERIQAIEEKFHGEGRVLIRPSGTEPLVRVMIEGQDQREIEEYAVELAKLLEAAFPV